MALVKKARATRSYGCAALEMVYVATGRIDAYVTPRLSPWDFGGGQIIVEEVGEQGNNILRSATFYRREE